MKVAIIGSGVIGVSSAYQLQREGMDVTLFDEQAGPALVTSYANGGQLSYAHIDPLANPAMIKHIPSLLLGRDSAFKVGLNNHWSILPWGLQFLLACRASQTTKILKSMSDLAMQSAVAMNEINQQLSIDYSLKDAGKLHLYHDAGEYQAAQAMSDYKQSLGLASEALSFTDAQALEPALHDYKGQTPVGVISSPDDQTGDAYKFTKGLFDYLVDNSLIKAQLNTRIETIQSQSIQGRGSSDEVTLVDNRGQTYSFNKVVVCAGTSSQSLLRGIGVRVAIYPMKGYSLTLPLKTSLKHSITNNQFKHVYTALGDKLRIAGYAQFVGYDRSIDQRYTTEMLDITRGLMPELADYSAEPIEWAGLRPMSPTGIPIVSETKVKNVLVNSGHGMLGWALAMGSAKKLSQLLTNK